MRRPEIQGRAKLTLDKDGYPVIASPKSNVAITGSHARWQGRNEETSYIAKLLGFQLGTPVEDDTGLTGTYDFTVSWILQRPGSTPPESENNGPTLVFRHSGTARPQTCFEKRSRRDTDHQITPKNHLEN